MKRLIVPCLLAAPLWLMSACGIATTSLRESLASRETGELTIAMVRDRIKSLKDIVPAGNAMLQNALGTLDESIASQCPADLATKKVTNDLDALIRMATPGTESPKSFGNGEAARASEIQAHAKDIIDRATTALSSASSPLKQARKQTWEEAKRRGALAKEQAGIALDSKKPDEKLNALAQAEVHIENARESATEANIENELVYSNYFKLHGGAATVRPYRFKPDASGTRFLTTDATTAFYAEMDFLYRTAWLEPGRVSSDLREEFTWTRLVPQDYEFRLGFINQAKVTDTSSSSSGSIDSSEDAADGDWYAEATLGWVMGMENISLNPADRDIDVPRGTWGPELFGNLQTDRNGFNSTGSYMVGLGTAWAIPISVGNVKRFATMAGGLYVGIHEYPRVDTDNGIHAEEALVHFNRLGTFGVRLDFMVPITSGIDAVVEARHYSPLSRNDIADDWSLFVGVSIPIGRLVRDVLQ